MLYTVAKKSGFLLRGNNCQFVSNDF